MQGQSRWYPTKQQVSEDPEKCFRQLLKQHYALLDQFNDYKTKNPPQAAPKASGPPPGCGPADTMLLGLRVAPVDTSTLADGATLKYKKVNGNFYFG